jgi:hypothetical protein
MSKMFLGTLLLGALVIIGAGCGAATPSGQINSNPNQQGTQANTYNDKAPVNINEETPELSEDSTKEDYDAVVEDVESLQKDLEGMNSNLKTLDGVNTNLQ